MDTILLIIGVVGLSSCGWVLRGYFINTLAAPYPLSKFSVDSEPDQEEPVDDPLITNYVSTQEHQLVLKRLDELERAGLTPKVEQNGNLPNKTSAIPAYDSDSGQMTSKSVESNSTVGEEDDREQKWKEIAALQEAYQKEREKERDIDYGREEDLFDLTQSYDGRSPGKYRTAKQPAVVAAGTIPLEAIDEEMDQRLLENRLEEGEDMDQYRQRLDQFATLSREILVMRLAAADTQLREVQETHQRQLLSLITAIIEKVPADVNLKSLVQSSFVSASTEISNEDGEPSRINLQNEFYKAWGY